MAFKSQAQRGYLYANKPKLAKEFEEKTPKGKKLPYKKDLRDEAIRKAIS